MFAEIDPILAARARHRGRRLDGDRDRARRDRGAREGHRADAAAARRRAARSTRSRCRGTGATRGLDTGDSANDLLHAGGDPNVNIERDKALDLRRARRAPAAAARPRAWSRVHADAPRRAPGRDAPVRGRPHAVTEIAVQREAPSGWASSPTRRCASAARPARSPASSGTTCPSDGRRFPRAAPTTTPASWAPTRGATCASSSCSSPRRAAAAARCGGDRGLAATGRRRRRRSTRAAVAHPLGLHVRRLQALHERRLPGRVPDRRADPHRVRDRRAAGRRLQRLRLLHPRVPVRRRRPRPRRRPRRASARSATTGSRTAWSPPARRRARPTRSSSAPTTSSSTAAERRVAALHDAGVEGAYLYGADPGDGAGGLGAFFLLTEPPERYGLPPDPVDTTRDLRRDLARRAAGAARRGGAVEARVSARGELRRAAPPSDVPLRPAGDQAAGVDAGDPRLPLRRRAGRRPGRLALLTACAVTTRWPAARGAAPGRRGAQPGAADLRPRRPARFLHAADVQGHLADERRVVDPRGLRDGDGARGRARAARRAPARWARRAGASALLGLPLSSYTGRAGSNTAIPVWHHARDELPFVFAAGAAMSAGSAMARLGERGARAGWRSAAARSPRSR